MTTVVIIKGTLTRCCYSAILFAYLCKYVCLYVRLNMPKWCTAHARNRTAAHFHETQLVISCILIHLFAFNFICTYVRPAVYMTVCMYVYVGDCACIAGCLASKRVC